MYKSILDSSQPILSQTLGKQRRKNLKGKWPGQHKYNGTSHNFVKRAVDSMDDCFDFMDEPLYGLRVNISQEVNCSGLGLKYVVLLTDKNI